MIKIRPAEPNDAPEMARVIVDTWFSAHEGQVSDEAFQQRKDEWGYAESERGWNRSIQEADGLSSQALVATDGGSVIAVAASEVTSADCAEVGALYVDLPYQRSGIGRRLLETIFDHYRGLGISTLQIAVLATNQPAMAFYERLGARNAGKRDDPEGLEIVYMWDLTSRERNTD